MLACLVFAAAAALARAPQPQPESGGDGLLAFLKQSIEWYRSVQLPAQISSDPSDSIYATYNRNNSLQALSLIFEFARAQAQQIELQHPDNTAPASNSDKTSRTLAQLVPDAQSKAQQASAALESLQQQAERSVGKKRRTLEEQIADQKSELELDQARLEALENMNAFAVAGASVGLLGKINELERTVPEVRAATASTRPLRGNPSSAPGASAGNAAAGSSAGTSSSNSASNSSPNPPSTTATATSTPVATVAPLATAAPAKQQQGNGIVALSSELFSLTSKLGAQSSAIEKTSQLRTALDKIRLPLAAQVRSVNQRGDELAAQPQSSDPAVLADRQKQIQALTAEFHQISSVLLPLAKASILLDAASNNLSEWRSETQRTYTAIGRALLLRVGILIFALVVVAVGSDFWRRAIFRYIREQRRRNQFLLLRRIVVTVVITLIFIFALSTEIGSLATFAGFLTAGVAVALQNVILSVAAYFFLIGRYGIRVGDRVQIGDVTGDVIDIGLVRLHLVELDTSGGEARPTGRIVVFSNSVVFQPTSNFFKQLPGSNFAWRRISLTLAPDVDYSLAQSRISSAVASVYNTYKSELTSQHRALESSLAIHIASPEPQTRLRLQQSGLEIIILYPVVLSSAAQIDDRMTHALLDAIANDPRLRLVGGGLTAIKPVDATPGATPGAAVQQN